MKKYIFTLVAVVSGSFFQGVVLAMVPPDSFYYLHKPSFAEIALEYTYLFFFLFFLFSQIIIIPVLLFTLYRMYVAKFELYTGFKKIVFTIFALVYPLIIVSKGLLRFYKDELLSNGYPVFSLSEALLNVLIFLQLFIISYLLRMLYRMYITKTIIYTGFKKVAITIFAFLYCLPILITLSWGSFMTISNMLVFGV